MLAWYDNYEIGKWDYCTFTIIPSSVFLLITFSNLENFEGEDNG
ncbi:hypothetical protein ABH916_003623 [Peribacillus frigoritolerans]